MEKKNDLNQQKKVPWYGYVALILTILFLSGLFTKSEGALRALDFTNVLGKYGTLGTLEEGSGTLASSFRGVGGVGVRDAWLFALWLAPSIMFAFGIIELCTVFKGLEAAQRLLTPIMKPILGLPGAAAVGLVASFTSADAGSSSTRTLYDDGYINSIQRLVFVAFQFSGPALVVNYYSLGAPLMDFLAVSPIIPLVLVIVMKFLGANLYRIYLNKFNQRKEKEAVAQ